jgi:hypothetical protein
MIDCILLKLFGGFPFDFLQCHPHNSSFGFDVELTTLILLGLCHILQGVYHCGYHSKLSFAATSYFIVQPGGNILVDRCDT